MGHKHLTADKREILGRLLDEGMSIRQAARLLGYSPSAICQEINRGCSTNNGGYDAAASHREAVLRRSRASQRIKHYSPELIEYVRQGLERYWSPEQIEGRLKLEFLHCTDMRISFKTVYRWLGKAARSTAPDPWRPFVRYLRLKRRGKRFSRSGRDRRGARSDLPSIEQRPSVVERKKRFGDWECDLVRGFKGQGYVLTVVERSTGLLLARPCPNKSMKVVTEAILSCLHGLGRYVHTITSDRGKEFYGFEKVEEALGAQMYFCHKMSPQERGLNEQINGLLRQFFPKRKPLTAVTNQQVQRAVALINNRPKKKYGYRTTMELIDEQGLGKVLSFA